jgi:hypothetical protein
MTRLISVRRTLAALALAPVLVAGLVACGGDDPGSTATDPAGSTAPAAAGLEPGDSVDPADFADRLSDGFANITTAHTTMNGDFGTGSVTGEGDVDYGSDTPGAALTMSSEMFGSDGAEVRLVGGAMYINIGQLSQDKFWKIDLDDPDNPLGALGSQLDPLSAVKLLEKGLTSVTYVGAEDSLDHYQAVVDPQSILAGMGPMASAGASSMPKSLDYDLWLDSDNRLNKLTSKMGDLGSLDMTLSDFGTDVSIEAPPADQVTEMPDMFSSAGPAPEM